MRRRFAGDSPGEVRLAATYLRKSGSSRARGYRAADDMRYLRSDAVAGKIISERLSVVRRRRADPGPARSIGFLQDRIQELETTVSAATKHCI